MELRIALRWLSVVGLVSWLAACTDAGKCDRGQAGCACLEPGSTCEPGLTCSAGRCRPAPEDAGVPPAPLCTASSFEAACRALCEAKCRSNELYCLKSRCEPDLCDAAETLTDCEALCDGAECLNELCLAEGKRECATFGFPDDAGVYHSGCELKDPACPALLDEGCGDVCGSGVNQTGGDRVGNGMCEDGASGSVSAVCRRGSDCGDCPPRK